MKRINKILILRFGAIGDVVHTTALFRSLKKFNPELKISYVTFKTPSLMIENDPDLEKIYILEGKTYKHLIDLAKILRKENFDVLINLQPSIKTKIFALILKAKNTLTYKKTFKLHAVENFWRTAKPLFKKMILDDKIQIYLAEESLAKSKNLVAQYKPDKKIVGFNMEVSSVRQGRKWSPKYWQELAQKLLTNYNCKIIITGANPDTPDIQALTAISEEIVSFSGKLSLTESAALLGECDLVISGDTGPLHIATALNTPVIGLYGAAPISRTGPYGQKAFAVKSQLDCIPCNRRKCKFMQKGQEFTPCLVDLKPDAILRVIEENSLL